MKATFIISIIAFNRLQSVNQFQMWLFFPCRSFIFSKVFSKFRNKSDTKRLRLQQQQWVSVFEDKWLARSTLVKISFQLNSLKKLLFCLLSIFHRMLWWSFWYIQRASKVMSLIFPRNVKFSCKNLFHGFEGRNYNYILSKAQWSLKFLLRICQMFFFWGYAFLLPNTPKGWILLFLSQFNILIYFRLNNDYLYAMVRKPILVHITLHLSFRSWFSLCHIPY